jgi:hypothetical protein
MFLTLADNEPDNAATAAAEEKDLSALLGIARICDSRLGLRVAEGAAAAADVVAALVLRILSDKKE